VRALSTVTMMAACAGILSACSGTAQQHSASDGLERNIASIFDPQLAARRNYDRALAEYQNCYAANLTNVDACDQQRQEMEAAVKVYSQTLNTGR
jgi:hypothetical protein